MRVKREKITAGFIRYVESEVITKIGDDRALQVILSSGINMLKINDQVADKVLKNSFVCAVSGYSDEDGFETYDLDALFTAVSESVKKHGYFPVTIPAIPFVSPAEKELKFSADDVDLLKTYIEDV